MRLSRSSRWGGLALVLAGALVLSGCGDDDDDDAGGGGNTSSAPTPTGAPIEIGLTNTENSPAGNYVDNRRSAEAAVEYVNKELGGVNGRPLSLETCVTNGSPESSIACANKFIASDTILVSPGIDVGAPAAIPLYAEAGIPYVGGQFISPEEYTAPTGYSFTGAAAGAVTGIAAYAAQQLQAKKVAIVGPDIPQLAAAVDGFMKPVLTKLGVTDVTTVSESAAAPDMTPALTRANSGDPDALILLFGGPSCIKAMQAVVQANIPRDKIIFGEDCAGKDQIESGGGGGDGAIFQSAFVNTDGDGGNAPLFRVKLAEYADGVAPGVSTARGFDSIMNIHSVLTSIQGEITTESLITALKATNETPAFLSHGFTCDGQQFPSLSAICDTNVRFYTYEGGKFTETNNQWVNGAAVLQQP